MGFLPDDTKNKLPTQLQALYKHVHLKFRIDANPVTTELNICQI